MRVIRFHEIHIEIYNIANAKKWNSSLITWQLSIENGLVAKEKDVHNI
jgi:hypothetical protein